MYVWVLETFNRDDEFCEHDSNIVSIYSEEHFEKAMEHYKTLCDRNVIENGEIEECEDKNSYYFSSLLDHYKGFKMNCVDLRKIEVQ